MEKPMEKIKDWSTIRIAYTCGIANDDGSRHYPTMADIAQEYGISLSSVTHKAAEERWAEARADFQRRVYESAVIQYENEFSRLLARADLDASYAAADLIHHIRRQIERGTEQERTSLAKNISRPLRELIDIVHRAVGVEQVLGYERDSEDAA